MPDIADTASELEQYQRDNALSRTRRYDGVSLKQCRVCGESIPGPRRVALPGVDLCLECAEIEEKRNP